MDSYAERYDFTPAELAELRRRAAETDPEFSDSEDITPLFGRQFRA